jgi:hypothetical protein
MTTFSRPCYRWKSFWLGLIGLACLVWEWFASSQRHLGIQWADTKISVLIGSSGGTIKLYYLQDFTGTGVSDLPGFRIHAHHDYPANPELLWEPPVRLARDGFDGLNVYIAWWLIILLYLITWLTTITWWHRRQRRLLDRAPDIS